MLLKVNRNCKSSHKHQTRAVKYQVSVLRFFPKVIDFDRYVFSNLSVQMLLKHIVFNILKIGNGNY